MGKIYRCHKCEKSVTDVRKMGEAIFCVSCAMKLQQVINKATQRLKIECPKFFRIAPREPSRPTSPRVPRGSTTPTVKSKREGFGRASKTKRRNRTPPVKKPAPTTSVSQLKKFFDMQKRELADTKREIKLRAYGRKPEPKSKETKSKSSKNEKKRVTKRADAMKSFTAVPKIARKAMESVEKRAITPKPGTASKNSLKKPSKPAPGEDDDLASLIEAMRAHKMGETSAIQSAAKDKKVLQRFELKYSIQDDMELGSGLTAVVKLCVENSSRKEYAVKIISKQNSSLDTETFRQEIKIMAKMKHENIIGMVDFFETTDFIYIVQELAYGGELFDRILDQKQFSEKDASHITKQMLSALAYMHDQGIVHRDMKPENILYSSFDENASIKISDFGFAKDTSEGDSLLTQQLGTQGYCAPEVFSGHPYDSSCDIWSLGVIVYILLCGTPPFVAIDEEEALNRPFWTYVNEMQKVQDKKVEFPGESWKKMSSDAKNFLTLALTIDPKKRPSASKLLKHTWIEGSNQTTSNLIGAVTGGAPFALDRPQDFVRARFEKRQSVCE
ncbi:hypothetical protein AAMO2058_000967000 [Amorphochlora amoebiformis]